MFENLTTRLGHLSLSSLSPSRPLSVSVSVSVFVSVSVSVFCLGPSLSISLSLSLSSLSLALSVGLGGPYMGQSESCLDIFALGWAKWGPGGVSWTHLGPRLSLCWAYVGLC